MDFDWNRARAFLATADHGTLSAAGAALGLAQPTVGRQIAALEEQLGVALFERAGNRLTLTPAGLDLLEHVRAMDQAANRVVLVASGRTLSLEGRVSVSAGEAISAFLLWPVLGALRTEFPGLELDIVATNDTSDLLRREADIAIRNFQPEQADLVAKRLRSREGWMYATPEYLARVGVQTAADLSRAEFIGWNRGPELRDGLNALGLQLTLANFAVVCSSHLVQWELCKAGIGVCVMLADIGDVEPRVVRILPDQIPAVPVQMWLTTHREVKTSARVRLVYDRLAQALS
ncbi:MAG: LysR family transcriptional regulator [Myxococcota bacterium]